MKCLADNEMGEGWAPTRQTLLSRLKNWEDQQSWQDFFNTYWKLIYGVALATGLNDDEAQEVVQTTVITVSKKIPDFKYDPAIGSFKHWLLTITRRRIADQVRRRYRHHQRTRPASESELERLTAEESSGDASARFQTLWDEEWHKAMADAALEKVKRKVESRRYQMFDFHVLKGWPAQKVAKKLHVSLTQVYYAKYKVSSLVKNELKKLESEMV